MKIGIYLPDEKPGLGGTSSLLKTISNGIKAHNIDKFELVILYKSGLFSEYKKEEGGITYININRYKFMVWFKCQATDIKYRFKNLKRKLWLRQPNTVTSSWMDMLAKKEKIDLYWFAVPVLESISTPYIYSLWDIGHRLVPEFPEMRSSVWDWNLRELTYQTMLPRATYVLTGNEQGKREILDNYPVPEDKIRIVEFPITDQVSEDEKKPEFCFPEKFFFYPAQFWGHKNHIVIIEALKALKEKNNQDVGVIFSGSDHFCKKHIEEMAEKYGVKENVIFAGFISSGELKYLYTHAVALIYPSLLGPNNLPPIEAAYLGCPVLISNIRGHVEEMGDAALYFDGYNSDELAGRMNDLLNDKTLCNELREKGYELAKRSTQKDYFSALALIFDEFSKKELRWKNS